jgi:hypothetical protein
MLRPASKDPAIRASEAQPWVTHLEQIVVSPKGARQNRVGRFQPAACRLHCAAPSGPTIAPEPFTQGVASLALGWIVSALRAADSNGINFNTR